VGYFLLIFTLFINTLIKMILQFPAEFTTVSAGFTCGGFGAAACYK
jgi:hypothetical protein